MRKLVLQTWLIIMVYIGYAIPAIEYKSVEFGTRPSEIRVLNQDNSGITLGIDIQKVNFYTISTPNGVFSMVRIPGFGRSFNIGEPGLPVAGKLISIPLGCELRTEIIEFDAEELSLSELEIENPIMPAQPSISKSDDPASLPFEYNREVYSTEGFYKLPAAETKIEGIMRGVRVARLSIAPMEYNPTENKIKIYKNLKIRITFENPDWQSTEVARTKYYSPYFEPLYSQLTNYESLSAVYDTDPADLVQYPVRYLIIADRMFESQLQPFVEWKIQKGFDVIVSYTDVIGSTTNAIRTHIYDMYMAGTPENPAPSFVLLVGDTPQIPSWPGSTEEHVTDFKYFELTGDQLPDIYYGRFSAQNTSQLQPQIDKTLEYEKYEMPDPSYLEQITLVSGVDTYYADTHGNGQLSYGTNLYFNLDHGIDPNVWLYPDSDEPDAASAIIQTVDDGIGFYNYTAHCSHYGPSNPSFTTYNIDNLTNIHKYLLGIGNCCLSNTFDEVTPCFGEAWLQAENKGGIGWIGATNSSYWYEDYYWGVGYGPVIATGAAYEETTRGAYDGIFHDHGEAEMYYFVTNGAIIFAGNLAVTAGGSLVDYYWEIYHLMGDPSIMTYFGVPEINHVTHDHIHYYLDTMLTVHADPGSYVGITLDGVLKGAGYIDSTGEIEIDLAPFGGPDTLDIVITAQNKEPYISTIIVSSEYPPQIQLELLGPWTAGIAYSYQLTATDGTGELTWTDKNNDLA
ncbi:MAG: hypothetical protein DRP46_11580, partial [Candidatus Zixiibacteriota bacterium]